MDRFEISVITIYIYIYLCVCVCVNIMFMHIILTLQMLTIYCVLFLPDVIITLKTDIVGYVGRSTLVGQRPMKSVSSICLSVRQSVLPSVTH